MLTVTDLRAWLDTLPDGYAVGIDAGGLALVALDRDDQPTDAYIEVGGCGDDD